MENKISKKILSILLIIMLTASDFFMLGSTIVSYATNLDSTTNNANIEFSAYFKDAEGDRVNEINECIKREDLKLYAEIKVKNEGYLNGIIEIANSNFKLKDNISSNSILSIEENKINLNQINAGETVELELDIEPTISEKIASDMLSKETTIRLTGTYMETTYKGLDIEAEKTVKLNLQIDETAQAELQTEIITNKVFSINGQNKRIVQLILKSRLTENQYPIKQTIIKVNEPQLGEAKPEEVKVLSLGTKATNGKTDTVIENWKNESGFVEIIINNNPNENNEISWKKDVYDELIITFVYPESADASKVELTTNSEIQIYNSESKFTAMHTVGIENKELNNIIASEKIMDSAEMYKGQLYVNVTATEKKEIPFNTTTKLEVRSTEIADTIKIQEQKDVFVAETTELDANTRFVKTSINKEHMIKLLGQDGFVEIKQGESTTKITKDSDTDESGNIVIEYSEGISEIEVTTSKPTSTGTLEINHTKMIGANSYTIAQLKTVTVLKSRNTLTALLGEAKVVENTTEIIKELKETSSQAELTINKENLSTMAENKEVIIGIKLNTDEVKYDLYKNPTIKIQLPQSVQEIKLNSFNKLYADEFEVERAQYNATSKIIEIVLKGEQLQYAPSKETQAYLQINMDVTLSKTQPSKTDKITMEFTNENTQATGVVDQPVNIVSPSGLVTMNNIETYNLESINGSSEDKQLAEVDARKSGGTDAQFKIVLINNTRTTINNVKILGNFPTNGEFVRGTETITNNFETTLKSGISAQNCTIYYSSNMSASSDVSNTNNGWTTNLSEVSNPKVYLIEIASMPAETNFEASYTVQLPTTLSYDLTSYAGYQVLYNETESSITQKAQSPLVGLTTGEGIKLETTVEAIVGSDTLKDGDTVKNGEVIKYRIITKNNGSQTLENIEVSARVPEGTVAVVPEEEFEYTGPSYYTEKTDITEVTEIIPSLAGGQTHVIEYEVRVKMDTANGTQISNKATAICGDFVLYSNELKNTVEEAKVRVTIKRILGTTAKLSPGTTMEYLMIVENLSNEEISNLKLQIMLENQMVSSVADAYHQKVSVSDDNQFNIDNIAANSSTIFRLYTLITKDNINEISAAIKITDSQNRIYRSNKDIQRVETVGATIKMTSPTAGMYVKEKDEIIYNITVTNTGSNTKTMVIKDTFSEYLKIEQILNDGQIHMQTVDSQQTTFVKEIANDLEYYIVLEAGQSKQVKIVTKVKETNEEFAVKTISNSAQVLIDGFVKATSEEVKHILKGSVSTEDLNIISGVAWLDANQNGQKDADEQVLPNINVKLFDISTNTIAKDKNGNNAETTTDTNGQYTFTKINEGQYIALFEYDTNKYELTTYMAEDVSESQNSNVILKTININGQEKICAVTDTIKVTESVFNINIGLKEILVYDLELDKFISRIVVQNQKGTKSYDYNESTFQKVEIHRKQINGSMVILEYTIRVKNVGQIAGYVTSIKDYLPSGLEFSSELNADWYISGQDLYTKSLANEKIEPGETKEIKLILTKTMNDNNVGLINNRTEIIETYNQYGKLDIDSTVNNEVKNEDDMGSADVIISISTGGTIIIYTILVILNTVLIGFAIYLIFIKNKKRI